MTFMKTKVGSVSAANLEFHERHAEKLVKIMNVMPNQLVIFMTFMTKKMNIGA